MRVLLILVDGCTGGAEHNKTIGYDAANEIITDAVAKGLRMLI
jgi:hypothetical protein